MKSHLQINLLIDQEHREAPIRPTTLVEAIDWAMKYAVAHRGVMVEVQAIVPQNQLVEHGHTLFRVGYPKLEEFQKAEILKTLPEVYYELMT